ncbi:hypothetical protein ALC53_07481 [Atta colombica]|uniref:Uncharacterized protein n=1 Tax=Atta colombica TaxID=520822 RepID=A0A195BD02_9HYME|nr:hypothetical protein ALC53_07481 [Atta colombica]
MTFNINVYLPVHWEVRMLVVDYDKGTVLDKFVELCEHLYNLNFDFWNSISKLFIFNEKNKKIISKVHFTYGRPLRISYLHSQPGGN